MSNWQDISTAPKDRYVLVYDAKLKRSVVAQHMTAIEDGSGDWVYARQLSANVLGHPVPAWAFICKEPTHWQPLPEPPNE